MLNSGADPNIREKFSETPLYIASFKNYYNIVNLLLINNAHPNIITHLNNTALSISCKNNYYDIVELLLINDSYKVSKYYNNKIIQTLLNDVCKKGDAKMLKLLLNNRQTQLIKYNHKNLNNLL